MHLTIVIPAYNEIVNLKKFLPVWLEYCSKNNFQLIIVNDGSNDGTYDFLNNEVNSGKEFRVFHFALNSGYGAALKMGIKNVQTEYLITIDADGQHDINDITLLVNVMMKNNADMVIGKRENTGFYRSLGKFIIRSIVKMLIKLPVHDINSGIKIYKTILAQKYLQFCPDSMAFSDVITLVFINNRHAVVEHPVTIQPRFSGKSTIGFSIAMDTVKQIFNIIIIINPMRFFFPLGMFFFITGLLWGIYIMFIKQDGISIGATLLILTGFLLFIIGMIAEQLSAIRRELVNKFKE